MFLEAISTSILDKNCIDNFVQNSGYTVVIEKREVNLHIWKIWVEILYG